jgi:hypothetical protein
MTGWYIGYCTVCGIETSPYQFNANTGDGFPQCAKCGSNLTWANSNIPDGTIPVCGEEEA